MMAVKAVAVNARFVVVRPRISLSLIHQPEGRSACCAQVKVTVWKGGEGAAKSRGKKLGNHYYII